jgi:hypothetical protein
MKTFASLSIFLAAGLAAITLFAPAAGNAQLRPLIATLAALDRGEGQAFTLSGRVQSVDYAQNIVVIRSHGDVYTVSVTPTTSVEHDGQIGSISDLRPGVHVRIKGSIVEGEMTAESIIVT